MLNTTEDQIHESIVGVLKLKLRGAVIHHSRNEGNRSGKRGLLDGVRGKKLGVQAGYPDLIIHYKGQTFFIEVKRKGTYLSPIQKAIRGELEKQGFWYFVCRDPQEAEDACREIEVEMRSTQE